METISWIICVVAMVGGILNIKKNKWCFVIWIATNLSWMIVECLNERYSLVIWWGFCLLTSIYGLREWTKNEI